MRFEMPVSILVYCERTPEEKERGVWRAHVESMGITVEATEDELEDAIAFAVRQKITSFYYIYPFWDNDPEDARHLISHQIDRGTLLEWKWALENDVEIYEPKLIATIDEQLTKLPLYVTKERLTGLITIPGNKSVLAVAGVDDFVVTDAS